MTEEQSDIKIDIHYSDEVMQIQLYHLSPTTFTVVLVYSGEGTLAKSHIDMMEKKMIEFGAYHKVYSVFTDVKNLIKMSSFTKLKTIMEYQKQSALRISQIQSIQKPEKTAIYCSQAAKLYIDNFMLSDNQKIGEYKTDTKKDDLWLWATSL